MSIHTYSDTSLKYSGSAPGRAFTVDFLKRDSAPSDIYTLVLWSLGLPTGIASLALPDIYTPIGHDLGYHIGHDLCGF